MPTQSSEYQSETSPQKLSTQIRHNEWFRQLTRELKRFSHLQTLFLKAVDWELGQQCQVLEFSHGCLNLAVGNANWAMRVRYNTPELIKTLRALEEFKELKTIHCYVHPEPRDIQIGQTAAPNPIPAESAACIAEVAQGIKEVKLKNALLKLAGKMG